MLHQAHSWEMARDRIGEEIASGRLAPDMRLPSEPELCRIYHVRRHSLRRALAALEAEGKLRIEHGRGAFVERAPLINYVVGTRTRFRQNLMAQGMTAGGETISERQTVADDHVAEALGIRRRARVFEICRRGFADDLPISVNCAYYDAVRFPDMAEKRRAGISVTDIYRAHGIEDYLRGRTTILTRQATEAEASLLMLRPGQPVLQVQKVDIDRQDRPIGFSESAWAGDRVQFTFEPSASERNFDV